MNPEAKAPARKLAGASWRGLSMPTAFASGFSRSLRIVPEIPAALLAAFLASLGCALRIVLEVAGTLLATFLAGSRCLIAVFGKVSGTATMLGHLILLFDVSNRCASSGRLFALSGAAKPAMSVVCRPVSDENRRRRTGFPHFDRWNGGRGAAKCRCVTRSGTAASRWRFSVMTRSADIRIGISGWAYAPWRGKFYPENLPHRRELAYVGDTFRTVEINGTFYGSQRPESFEKWADATPADFVFAVKGPRYITHTRRLRQVETPLANFFATGLLGLGRKLGPILWQFPPNFKFDAKRMDDFLALLPHDAKQAAKLARKHDRGFGKKAPHKKPTRNHRLRHAIEIRHESFAVPEFIRLLRTHNVALVCADTVEWPRLMDVTADFVYCRLHGSEELYASGYDSRSIGEWARRAVDWAQGREPHGGKRASDARPRKRATRDVFIYFDNDRKVRAPLDAKSLVDRIGRRLKRRAS
jgi:uncharacterized protein YecE (DUF72 family)